MINLNVANCAVKKGVKKLFYSSSACVYSQDHQQEESNNYLSENMAYPANPDSDYGWEKLMSERLYQAYARNYNLNIRIARFHNIYGPQSDFYTGRDKAPAAICRKVGCAESEVEIWGSGQQVRTFLYIDDCLDAIEKLMKSEYNEPINIGSEEFISINDLTKMVIQLSGKDHLTIKNIKGPVGVGGRGSNNGLIEEVLDWEPKISLQEGMKRMYQWVSNQLAIMPFIYEDAGNGKQRKYIAERDVTGKIERYYF
jgi:nucleoside-diphosphate-sugar epimerase